MIHSRYPGGGQMMMSGGGGAPGMGMRMPMTMRTQMPPINQPGGIAMVNNQPMSVPGQMRGNPAGYNVMESGVQPVRGVANPSHPTPRPPSAPQVSALT